MSASSPSAAATLRVKAARRLTPRLILPERTIAAWRAAASILFRSSSESPVVPMTWTMRACAASAANSTLAAGEEKSTMPSALTTAASASAATGTPSRSSPASAPASAPSAGEFSRSKAAARTTPFVSTIVLISIRPMRPAAPVTTSRISVIDCSNRIPSAATGTCGAPSPQPSPLKWERGRAAPSSAGAVAAVADRGYNTFSRFKRERGSRDRRGVDDPDSIVSAWLRPFIAFDDDEVGGAGIGAQSHGGAIFRRIVAGERGFIVLEFDHDMAGAQTPLRLPALPRPDEKARAVFREGSGIGGSIGFVRLRIAHIDMRDPITLGHAHTPSTMTYSTVAARSRFFLAR